MSQQPRNFLLNDSELDLFIDFFHFFNCTQISNKRIQTRSGSDILAEVHTFEVISSNQDSYTRYCIAKMQNRQSAENIRTDLFVLSNLHLNYEECGILILQNEIDPDIVRMIKIELSDRWIPISLNSLIQNDFLTDRRDDFFKILHSNKEIISGLFIKNDSLTNNFYNMLIEEINLCYHRKAFTAVSILSRKLIENLLIELLKTKFGNQDETSLGVYYDTENGRHNKYSILLENFWSNFNEHFRSCCNIGNRSILSNLKNKMKELKNTQDATAHSVEVRKTKSTIDIEKEKIVDVFNFLCYILHNLN